MLVHAAMGVCFSGWFQAMPTGQGEMHEIPEVEDEAHVCMYVYMYNIVKQQSGQQTIGFLP